jgi:hypothetical protein
VSRRGYCARRSRVTDGGTIRFAEQHAARLGVHCTTRRGLGAGPSRVLRRASTRAPRRALGTRAGSVAGFLSHQQRGSRGQLRAQSGLDTRRHLRLWYVPHIDTCHITDYATDVHHGNGTEDIMATNQRFKDHVLFISSHCSEIYPHTGVTSPAKNIVNVPLKNRSTSAQFRKAFK